MDSEHRHELKENDLAEFLAHFGQWWAKYGTKLLVVVLAIVVSITGKRWYDVSRATKTDQAWHDLALTTSPEGYRSVAMTHSDPAVRALAYLRGGDLLLAQAVRPPNQDEADQSTVASDPAQNLQGAALMYQAVVQDPDAALVYQLNAQMGLAAVAEGRRDWNQARSLYDAITQQAGDRYAFIATRARARLTMLDRLEKPVMFAPDSPTPDPTPSPSATDQVTESGD